MRNKIKINKFKSVLYALFETRITRLMKLVGMKYKGPLPVLTKKDIFRAIKKLQNIAGDLKIRRYAEREFKKIIQKRKSWYVKRGKGWGDEAKIKSFKIWYAKYFQYHNLVYIFWDGKKCLRVGVSERGRHRPTSYFGLKWFSKVKRIDILTLSSSRDLHKLECLAIHRYNPVYNKIKPPDIKYQGKCPICRINSNIKKELDSIFPL
jgi:hypothetical protein